MTKSEKQSDKWENMSEPKQRDMETLKTIWNFLFNHKTICGKQWIEDSMTKKYGEDWLKQCLEGLKDPSVRDDLKETLKL
jgi:hypothetical protein